MHATSALVLQVGANSHSSFAAHQHDPVPLLIKQGWHAVLIEPQPTAAASLRKKHGANPHVRVVNAAVCLDAAASAMPLFFVNASRTHGSNDSDTRCLGSENDVEATLSGMASFSEAHIIKHERFYRYTPSQCARCAQRLSRPLPPTCMRRVFSANLDRISVACAPFTRSLIASLSSTFSDGGGVAGSKGLGERVSEQSLAAGALVVDAEGADALIVERYLESGLPLPSAIVYESAHLRSSSKRRLTARLAQVGMAQYEPRSLRRMRPPASIPSWLWRGLRLALSRVEARDNIVWLRNDTNILGRRHAGME